MIFIDKKQRLHICFKVIDVLIKYFHSLVKKRAAKNSITALKLPNGELTTSMDQVAMEFENFYVNLFSTPELVKGYTRKHCSPRCMIKVDLRKAYGTISLDFLKSVLLNIGFPLQFVKWIMECVATASFSISINGTLHGFFRGKRGLRQGTIWNKVRAWIGMPRQMSTLDSAVKWIKKDRAGVWIKAKTIRIAFIYTIYWIWRVRNATRFDDKKTREEEVFERIQYMVYKILYTPFIPL
ncbi:unnamed protein product [Cuscuta europaea]|uniref:Reverse transcriptase domain-containing protein n=1 Tax=Cuscuta europaea TaxID=41803 RepID=A0A9P0VSB0_CUSEU|nr:unnamed protein product [Cuscuta europaea]